jgi:NADPH-dependent 2,4-dienoyl-CoA reductase/sulfur reductase-like enzyme
MMKEYNFDTVVVGGGAAGMAAALEVDKAGFSTAIIEREERLGGILGQCIHNGFGLHEFNEELTGPEYAENFIEMIRNSDIKVFLNSTLTDISSTEAFKELFCYSGEYGVFRINARTIVLAMGCRERNRGNIRIPGTRPAGIYTAGLAQRLINIEGYIPGKDIVILGAGDIGLIMARRMQWAGCNVHGVIEIQPYPSGITRNIVGCLNDFGIPLYLSHVITEIHGKGRIEKVSVTPLVEGKLDQSAAFEIPCDTLLLSVGLVPENELSRTIGIKINPQTGGPIVDSAMMTREEGIFACGNVLHVHDLVDFVTEESRRTGIYVSNYLQNKGPARQIRIKVGANVRYVNPGKLNPDTENRLYLRTMIIKQKAEIEIRYNNELIKTVKKNNILPSEMIDLVLPTMEKVEDIDDESSVIEIKIT